MGHANVDVNERTGEKLREVMPRCRSVPVQADQSDPGTSEAIMVSSSARSDLEGTNLAVSTKIIYFG